MNLLKQIEQEQIEKLSAGKDIPDFAPGDTVIVNVKVREGDRTRVHCEVWADKRDGTRILAGTASALAP